MRDNNCEACGMTLPGRTPFEIFCDDLFACAYRAFILERYGALVPLPRGDVWSVVV